MKENIIAQSLPMDLQFTKRRVGGGASHAKEPFFWSDWEKENAQNIVDLMLPRTTPEEQNLLQTLSSQLKGLYNLALKREKKFLQDLQIEKEITQPSDLLDFTSNQNYASFFNTEVSKKIYSKGTNNLRQLFQDVEYAAFLARSPNIFSLTRASEYASENRGKNISKNDASYDLANLFLTQEGKLNIQKVAGRKTLQVRDFFTTKGELKKDWLKKLQNFYNNYIGSGIGNAIINSPECIQILIDELSDILNSELGQMFAGGSIRAISFEKGHVGKGVSKEVESALKTTLKNLSVRFINTKTIPMQFENTYGGLTLSSETQTGGGFYEENITAELYSYGLLTNEQMVSVLYDTLYTSIKIFQSKEKKYNMKLILEQFEKNKTIISDVIRKDLVKQKEERSEQGVRKIIAKWGYAQTRGILGELAAAISIATGVKGSEASISGSNTTGAGEVSMDVVAIINQSKYGFQVKNFKSLKQTSFYATDFAVEKENLMKKYFGDFADGYYWLFANEKMLNEEGLIMNFKERVEQSFYDFSDNFLRISSGDTPDFSYSDAFFISGKIIPSSYIYSLLIQTVKNAKKNSKRFILQTETNMNQYSELQEGVEFNPVLVPNLINGMNARIEFKGINFNLNNI